MATVSAYLLDDYLLTRVRVPGPAPDHPINMALLIDTSESMDHGRLAAVKQTLHAVEPLLRSRDKITLVCFNHEGHLLLDHLELDAAGDRLTQFYNVVDRLRATGSTNLSAGLEMLFSAGTDYDAIVLLTDGQVNCGLTSVAGLRTMALGGVAGRAFHALGYGADHNRILLRDLATKSAGSYCYVDSDEILPVAIGDIISGLRTEMLRGVVLEVLRGDGLELDAEQPGGAAWISQEAGGWYVGSMVADRDYWVVARRNPAVGLLEPTVAVRIGGSGGPEVSAMIPADDDRPMVREQIVRARAAALLLQISEAMESQHTVSDSRDALVAAVGALKREIQVLPTRPLLLRILGQLTEAEELLSRVAATAPPDYSYLTMSVRGRGAIPTTPPRIQRQAALDDSHLLARMASGCTVLSTQRGAASRTAAEEEAETDPTATLTFFSSPAQVRSAAATQTVYQSYRPAPRG